MPAPRALPKPAAPRSAFAEHCAELLRPLGPVRVKRMFGGHGFYVDDVFVALIAFDTLFLKVDATTQPRFEAEGCQPFVYEAAGRRTTMSYRTAPESAMESPDAMRPWARLAMEAALRARNAKPAAVKRRAAPVAAKKTTPRR